VKHLSVCWDSVASGAAQAHAGATVTLRPASGAPLVAPSDANGLARFERVPEGNFNVDVTAADYTPGSAAGSVAAGATARPTVEIQLFNGPGGTVVCSRQHTPRPANPPTVSALPAIFWHDNFMIVIREIAWLLFMLLMVVFLVIAIVNAAMSLHMHPGVAGFALPAVCFAALAFLTHIIFGMIPGVIMMVLAGAAWLVLVGLTIAAAAAMAGGTPVMLPLDFVWFPVLCGMWTSFFVFLPIRMDYGIETHMRYLLLFPIPALVVGLVGGLSGHVFKNDGAVDPYTAHHVKMSLPFAGARYCVQGNRGYFSHYTDYNQERCYDFAVPTGSNVLAIEEGHVIEFRDDKDGSAFDGSGNTDANYIYVAHKDGSFARYLHLMKDGISSLNPVLVANSTSPDATVYHSDVHVHAGQALAKAGSTGISRFPHIHLGLYAAAGPRAAALGLEFKDADVQRHGGRCYTFRQYLSSNPDNGPISV
jgi:hypothetical protein